MKAGNDERNENATHSIVIKDELDKIFLKNAKTFGTPHQLNRRKSHISWSVPLAVPSTPYIYNCADAFALEPQEKAILGYHTQMGVASYINSGLTHVFGGMAEFAEVWLMPTPSLRINLKGRSAYGTKILQLNYGIYELSLDIVAVVINSKIKGFHELRCTHLAPASYEVDFGGNTMSLDARDDLQRKILRTVVNSMSVGDEIGFDIHSDCIVSVYRSGADKLESEVMPFTELQKKKGVNVNTLAVRPAVGMFHSFNTMDGKYFLLTTAIPAAFRGSNIHVSWAGGTISVRECTNHWKFNFVDPKLRINCIKNTGNYKYNLCDRNICEYISESMPFAAMCYGRNENYGVYDGIGKIPIPTTSIVEEYDNAKKMIYPDLSQFKGEIGNQPPPSYYGASSEKSLKESVDELKGLVNMLVTASTVVPNPFQLEPFEEKFNFNPEAKVYNPPSKRGGALKIEDPTIKATAPVKAIKPKKSNGKNTSNGGKTSGIIVPD